tara:strand:+ start:1277 stop:2938 length:1662 start_codon:yes stop_codon:yes gene_type:complete
MELSIDVNPWKAYQLMQRISYKDYYALSEFIDNSVQSYLDNKERINQLGQNLLSVKISIDSENEKLVIRDDAGGISEDRFIDALKLDVPKDSETSLHEFGVGMKIAALWLGDSFTIETSALNEDWKTKVEFDLNEIREKNLKKLDENQIITEKADKDDHYTILTINLNRKIHYNRFKSIKFHITDVYRGYIEENDLSLSFQDEICECESEKILNSPYWNDKKTKKPFNYGKNMPSLKWEKDIDFEMPDPISNVKGRVYILDKGSKQKSGLVIYRRGRAVLGAGLPDPNDQKDRYRPKEIFQTASQSKFERIQGYLHFGPKTNVSSTKLLDWNGGDGKNLEHIFIDKLKKELEGDRKKFEKAIIENIENDYKKYLPLLRHAEQFRKQIHIELNEDAKNKQAEIAIEETTNDIKQNTPETSESILKDGLSIENQKSLDPLESIIKEKQIKIRLFNTSWLITIRVNDEKNQESWYQYFEDNKKNEIGVSLAMNHPFTVSMMDKDGKVLETMIRISAALALSEVLAKNYDKDPNVRDNYMRIIFNKILLKDLSKTNL